MTRDGAAQSAETVQGEPDENTREKGGSAAPQRAVNGDYQQARRAAAEAICEALGEDTTMVRLTGVEATGMSFSNALAPVSIALLALDALRSLPVEQRMEAMGMVVRGVLVSEGKPYGMWMVSDETFDEAAWKARWENDDDA